MNRLRISMLAGAVLLSVANGPAAARDFADIYTECGLGALIAPKNPAVAAVTNVTWDLGTTAISSNISSPDSCNGGKANKASFIYDNYAQLETDLARGSGRHLTVLLALSGCAEHSRDQVSHALRQDFSVAVGAAGYSTQTRYDQAQTLFNLVDRRLERDFKPVCSAT